MIFIYPGTLKKNMRKLQRVFEGEALAWLCDFHKGMTMEQIIENPLADSSKTSGKGLPFVYFVDEPVDKISALQSRIEEEGLDLKAMAISTEENRRWMLRQLMEEVEREAKYFEKRDHLADLILAADEERFAKDADYRNCFLLARDLLKEEELSERMLDTAVAILESFSREKR